METKKIVEALALGSVIVVSMAAQTASAGLACNNGTAATITTGSFIQSVFPVKCSSNVFVDYVDSTAVLAVTKGMSNKGMHSFGGSTEGGAVKACQTTSISFATPTAGTTSGSNGCS